MPLLYPGSGSFEAGALRSRALSLIDMASPGNSNSLQNLTTENSEELQTRSQKGKFESHQEPSDSGSLTPHHRSDSAIPPLQNNMLSIPRPSFDKQSLFQIAADAKECSGDKQRHALAQTSPDNPIQAQIRENQRNREAREAEQRAVNQVGISTRPD